MMALIGLVVVTWLLGRSPVPTETPLRSSASEDASYHLKDAYLYRTDADGRIIYRIRARSAERPADGGPLKLDSLTLEYEPAAEPHWLLSAASGVADDARGLLELDGGVRLESGDIAGNGATTILADNLTLDTGVSTATTPDRVSLSHGATRFEATGLTADLSSDRIDLHSDVSARLVR